MSQKKIKRYDIVEKQGSTIHFGVPVLTADGELANLGTFQARCQIRNIITDELFYDGTPVSFTEPHTPGVSIDVGNAMVIILIPSNVTEAFTWREGKYDIELFNGNNPPVVIPLQQGKFRLVREVTK